MSVPRPDNLEPQKSVQESLVIRDPERIRALAHPLRLRLLEYLATVDSATTTQCAQALDQSVPNCSFHLKTLHKYGYIEPAPQRGREKPWRTAHKSVTHEPVLEDPSCIVATTELAKYQVQVQTARILHWLEQEAQDPQAELLLSSISTSGLRLQEGQLKQLTADMRDLLDKYSEISRDHADDDPSVLAVKLFNVINVERSQDV